MDTFITNMLILPKELLMIIYMYDFHQYFSIYERDINMLNIYCGFMSVNLIKKRKRLFLEKFLDLCAFSKIPLNFITLMCDFSVFCDSKYSGIMRKSINFHLRDYLDLVMNLEESSTKQDWIFHSMTEKSYNEDDYKCDPLLIYIGKSFSYYSNINYILYMLYILGMDIYNLNINVNCCRYISKWEDERICIEHSIKYKLRNFDHIMLKNTLPFRCELPSSKDKYLLELLQDTKNGLLTHHVLSSFPNILC